MRETSVQQRVQLRMAQQGHQIWRNNVGACETVDGRQIRFGLANTSKEMNAKIKSSDLIGITTITITPDMVGQQIGVFTAPEIKATDWVFRPSDKRAVAQNAFHDIVRQAGGFAGFVRNLADLTNITKGHIPNE